MYPRTLHTMLATTIDRTSVRAAAVPRSRVLDTLKTIDLLASQDTQGIYSFACKAPEDLMKHTS